MLSYLSYILICGIVLSLLIKSLSSTKLVNPHLLTICTNCYLMYCNICYCVVVSAPHDSFDFDSLYSRDAFMGITFSISRSISSKPIYFDVLTIFYITLFILSIIFMLSILFILFILFILILLF